MLDNLIADEEESSGIRNVVRQNDAENTRRAMANFWGKWNKKISLTLRIRKR